MSKPNQQENALKLFSPVRVAIPLILGLGFSAFLIIRSWDSEAFNSLDWSANLVFWFAMSLVAVFIRQGSYMYRIRLLSGKKINWKQSFQVIAIWEYASAITPSIVGGTAAALYLLNKEKINTGKSTAIVLLTAYLDELFFILFTPLVLLIIGLEDSFPQLDFEKGLDGSADSVILYSFVFGYILLLFYTLFLAWGIFRNPVGLKKIIIKIFSIRWLKRWEKGAERTGEEVVAASREFSSKSKSFWTKAFLSTMSAWVARYVVVNCVILAFSDNPIGLYDQLVILGRQLPLWIILLIPVSPGGAGIFETAFPRFYIDYFSETKDIIAFVIRFFSYYIYLILGAIILPQWLNRVIRKKKN